MAQFIAFRSGIEVSGHPAAFLSASGRFAPAVRRILIDHGMLHLGPEDWHPMQSWLDALREIAALVGENTLFMIGKKVPDVATMPSGMDSLEAALRLTDVAYHLHHRLDGEVLIDKQTGAVREGIGHYLLQSSGARQAVMVCSNPYPSEFDRGLLTGLARKFKPAATVSLDETRPTRKDGTDECTYILRW
jgi:hypothetical protein